MPAVHLDLYIVRDSDPLQFRTNDLAKVLDARANLDRPVIVEGILILKVLGEIGRTPDFLVFVHRISHKSSLRTLTEEYLREFNPRQKANQIIRWSSAKRDRAILRAHRNRPPLPNPNSHPAPHSLNFKLQSIRSITMSNLVICCDGTGNEISENISNVLKLYRCLRKTRQDPAAAAGVLRSRRRHGDGADPWHG